MQTVNDFTSLKTVLIKISETIGPLTKLKYSGGNDDELDLIFTEFNNYFCSASYLKNNRINMQYEKDLKNVLICLIVNTEFEKQSFRTDESLTQFVDKIPSLSKCVLIHLISEFELSKLMPSLIPSIDSYVLYEMIDEFLIYLKRTDPKKSLIPAVNLLKSIILIFTVSEKNSENGKILEKLVAAGIEILNSFEKVNSDLVQGWNSKKIYSHMGFKLINLLRLIQICEDKKEIFSEILNKFISACISIMEGVSLNVYCLWAEIPFEGINLQTAIAFEGYSVRNKLKDYEPASKLVEMISSIARKPKPIQEIIEEMDLETIANNIYEAELNSEIQKQLFSALFKTDIFNHKKSIDCLITYSHLCTENNVYRLLNLSKYHETDNVKEIVLNCAKILETSTLSCIITRFFHERGLNSHLCIQKNFESCLSEFLERTVQHEQGFNITKEIQILLIQNPEKTFECLFKECLKNSKNMELLKDTLNSIQEIAQIDSLWTKIFHNIFNLTENNLLYYINFINALIELRYILTFEMLSEDVFAPKINEAVSKKSYKDLLLLLKLLKEVMPINGFTSKLLATLLITLNDTRCKFIEFSKVKQECAKIIVEILRKISPLPTGTEIINVENLSDINKFYLDSLTNSNVFLNYLVPRIENSELCQTECTCCLLQILPQCVLDEWKDVFEYLTHKYSLIVACNMFFDTILLICELVSRQNSISEVIQNCGVQYCIENYGRVIKFYILNNSDERISRIGCKRICRLLKHLPNEIKEEDGLKLAQILPDKVLRKMKNNESFIVSLGAIGNTVLSQTIAKRVASTEIL